MKRIALAVAGIAVAGVLGVGASPAAAASQADASRVTATAEASGLLLPAEDLPRLRGKYWSLTACQNAGYDGVARGHWTRWQCTKGTLQWVLWSD